MQALLKAIFVAPTMWHGSGSQQVVFLRNNGMSNRHQIDLTARPGRWWTPRKLTYFGN